MKLLFLVLIILILLDSLFSLRNRQLCINQFDGKQVRAIGDWSPTPWDPAEQYGLMKLDSDTCIYSLTIAGLKYPNTTYQWKVSLN